MASQSLTKFDTRFVTSADGTHIYADAIGNRSPYSPVIVMIHGFCMSKAAFDPIFDDRRWTSDAFLVRYDVRGHGKSGKPTSDEAWESRRLSEDFEAVCKGFGVTKAFVMGWSLGATHFADIVNYNTSVTISGFICTSGPLYVEPTVFMRVSTPGSLVILPELTQTTNVDTFRQAAVKFISWLSNDLSPELSRILLAGVNGVPKYIIVKMATRTQDPEKMLQEARNGQLQLLVIACGKDMIIDLEGYRAVVEESGWKNCTLRLLEEADHMPWISRAEEFREAVIGWVRECGCYP